MKHLLIPIVLGAALSTPVAHPAAQTGPANAARAVALELDQGELLLQHGDYFEALKRLTRAHQLSGNTCTDCLLGMAEAMQGMKSYQNVLDTTAKALAMESPTPAQRSRAHRLRAEAFQALAEKDPTKYPDAEKAFREALTLNPRIDEEVRFRLALVLLKLGRDDDARVELQRITETRTDTLADDARALIATPRRGRENYAPEFSIVTVDGAKMSLDSLRGKVVLIDFWATTCPPCVNAMNSLRKLEKAHASEPFVMLSVGLDRDEIQWRRFTAKNEMTWPQYWDKNLAFSSGFKVSSVPTYVLLDGEGIERFRATGTGFNQARGLSDEIEKTLAAKRAGP